MIVRWQVTSTNQRRDAWRLLIPPLLWVAVVVGLVVLIGVIVGAGAGGLWDRGGCNASTCTTAPFDWHAATKAGLRSAVLALVAGYVAVVGVRAFVRFADAGPPAEK
jgi:hypothetical protein